MKKILLTLVLMTFLAGGLFSAVNVLSPVGPTIVSLVGILEDKIDSAVELDIEFWTSFDQITASLVSKDADIVIVPVALGEMLYDKGMDVQLAAVTLWKSFYMVTSDIDADSLSDLKGVEIYTPQGTGQTGDVLMRYKFRELGLEVGEDVEIKYAKPPEIVGLMAKGKVKAAVVPEPFVTLMLKKVDGSEITFDLQAIWGEETGNYRVPITGVMVRKSALVERPLEISSALNAINDSIDFAMGNKDEAVALTTKYFSGMPAPVLKESLSRSEYAYKSVLKIRNEVQSFMKTINEIYPEIPVPDEGFYAK